MKRKIIAEFILFLIVLSFVFSNMVFSNDNDPTLRLSVNNTNVHAGEEVEISVFGGQICGTSFSITYDSNILQFLSPIEVSNNWNKTQLENTIFLNTSNYEVIETEEKICILKFKVLENVNFDSTIINFSNMQIAKADASTQNFNDENIEIHMINTNDFLVNVSYSTTEITNENVTVTLIANKEVQDLEGWTKSNNGMELTKEYTENKEETVIVKDLQGNEKTVSISINNINKTPNVDETSPVIDVSYSTNYQTNGNTVVTITSDKELKDLEGWEKSSDGKSLTKEYTINVIEKITVEDINGNKAETTIMIKNINTESSYITNINAMRRLITRNENI